MTTSRTGAYAGVGVEVERQEISVTACGLEDAAGEFEGKNGGVHGQALRRTQDDHRSTQDAEVQRLQHEKRGRIAETD